MCVGLLNQVWALLKTITTVYDAPTRVEDYSIITASNRTKGKRMKRITTQCPVSQVLLCWATLGLHTLQTLRWENSSTCITGKRATILTSHCAPKGVWSAHALMCYWCLVIDYLYRISRIRWAWLQVIQQQARCMTSQFSWPSQVRATLTTTAHHVGKTSGEPNLNSVPTTTCLPVKRNTNFLVCDELLYQYHSLHLCHM